MNSFLQKVRFSASTETRDAPWKFLLVQLEKGCQQNTDFHLIFTTFHSNCHADSIIGDKEICIKIKEKYRTEALSLTIPNFWISIIVFPPSLNSMGFKAAVFLLSKYIVVLLIVEEVYREWLLMPINNPAVIGLFENSNQNCITVPRWYDTASAGLDYATHIGAEIDSSLNQL